MAWLTGKFYFLYLPHISDWNSIGEIGMDTKNACKYEKIFIGHRQIIRPQPTTESFMPEPS